MRLREIYTREEDIERYGWSICPAEKSMTVSLSIGSIARHRFVSVKTRTNWDLSKILWSLSWKKIRQQSESTRVLESKKNRNEHNNKLVRIYLVWASKPWVYCKTWLIRIAYSTVLWELYELIYGILSRIRAANDLKTQCRDGPLIIDRDALSGALLLTQFSILHTANTLLPWSKWGGSRALFYRSY